MTTLVQLRAEALAARAANQPDRAAAAWRTLLGAAPDDWALALELKLDLLAGLHNPDHDPLFRRAARALPDAEWIAHHADASVLAPAELDRIAARARRLLARTPGDLRLHGILGQVARHRRDWPAAAAHFAAAAHPLLDEARRYAAVPPFPDGPVDYAVFVINLDRNHERWADLVGACTGFPVPPTRLPAMLGTSLPAAAAAALTGDPAAPRGTLGCSLSHVAAWERFVASGVEHALILEDDALPLLVFPPSIAALRLPAGWDLVWVNDRMEPPDGAVLPAAECVRAMAPQHDAVGADAYLLSSNGARRLLDAVAADGLAGDIDWRMLAYALSPADRAAIPAGHAARALLDPMPDAGPQGPLAAYALRPAWVREASLRSDRQDDDRLARGAAA